MPVTLRPYGRLPVQCSVTSTLAHSSCGRWPTVWVLHHVVVKELERWPNKWGEVTMSGDIFWASVSKAS